MGDGAGRWMPAATVTLALGVGALVLLGWVLRVEFVFAPLLVVSGLGLVGSLVAWYSTSAARVDTARRRAEEQLRALARTASDAIVSTDRTGRITYVNPSAERLFGYPTREAIGLPLTALLPARFDETERAALARQLAEGAPHASARTVAVVGRRRDGTELPLELSIAPWSLQGEVFFTGIMRDISERQDAESRAEEHAPALELATSRLNTLVRGALALTSSLETEAILTEVVRCAPRLVSGRSAILRLMSAQGRLEIRAAWGLSERYLARAGEEGRYSMEAERVLAARRPLVIDDLATRPDLPLQSTLLEEGLRTAIAVPIARPDRPLGVLTVHAEAAHAFAGQDLSLLTVLAEQTAIAIDHARLFREAETRQARLAEQAREMEAFAYTVSHDLKTPLRAMDGYARALIEDYGGQLDAAGVRYLTSIAAAASRMGELIDDLLRYSRIERREMRSETVAFEPLLDRICGDLAGEMRAKGLTVRRELAVGSVEGDTEGLRMALANLVGNAVKFSPPAGGTITVGTRVEGESVLLWVTDTGIGFDMRYAERIFRIFERLNRDDEYPGTGIGLAIVRKVAERHGGRAWATSEPGVGSTFQVALPLSRGGPP